jgi:CrcB protein
VAEQHPEPGTSPGLDPDADLALGTQRRELPDRGWRVLSAISAGGVIGAELRYGIAEQLSPAPGRIPWAIALINVTGGFAMGVLLALIARTAHPHPLIRPFLGVGILGGYTTFSTYSTDTYRLLDAGRVAPGLAYLTVTLAGALAATLAGQLLVGALTGPRRAGPGAVAGRR